MSQLNKVRRISCYIDSLYPLTWSFFLLQDSLEYSKIFKIRKRFIFQTRCDLRISQVNSLIPNFFFIRVLVPNNGTLKTCIVSSNLITCCLLVLCKQCVKRLLILKPKFGNLNKHFITRQLVRGNVLIL